MFLSWDAAKSFYLRMLTRIKTLKIVRVRRTWNRKCILTVAY